MNYKINIFSPMYQINIAIKYSIKYLIQSNEL